MTTARETTAPSTSLLADERITLAGLLFESAAALQRRLADDLQASAGLAMTTYEVLVRLARSPGERLAHSELSRQLSLSSGGITRVIDRIEKDGYVCRERDTSDKRVYHVALTDRGRRVLLDALPHHLDTLEDLLVAPLGTGGVVAFEEVLRPLRDALVNDHADRPRAGVRRAVAPAPERGPAPT
jgi:MarR family transcriptional regulator, 2-MHQ and catechol-resistance regulon repressor